MIRSEVREIFDKYIENVYGEKKSVKESDNLVDDLGLDSLDTVEIIMHFEEETNIEMNDDKFYDVKTVSDVLDVVCELTK